jgi:hypothetical protein
MVTPYQCFPLKIHKELSSFNELCMINPVLQHTGVLITMPDALINSITNITVITRRCACMNMWVRLVPSAILELNGARQGIA